MSTYIQLNRHFAGFSSSHDGFVDDWEYVFHDRNNGHSLSWDELLEQDRVVILAEAGSGKTEERSVDENKQTTADVKKRDFQKHVQK